MHGGKGWACNNHNMRYPSLHLFIMGCGPHKGKAPGGRRGGTPDHFLWSGLLQLLSSQSPRLAHGSAQEVSVGERLGEREEWS